MRPPRWMSLAVAPLMLLALPSLAGAQTVPASAPPQADTPAAEADTGEDIAATVGQEAASEAIRALDERYEEQRKAVNEEFRQRVATLQEEYLTELAGLAAQSQGTESTEAYRRLFAYAIATEQFEHAAPMARDFLESQDQAESRLRDLAEYVHIVAMAERGEHEQAVEELRSYLQTGRAGEAAGTTDGQRALAFAEDLIQRLVEDGQYGHARSVPALILDQGQDLDPAIQAHLSARQTQLGLVGQPAPPLKANDVDGGAFQLADLRGQVVLVDFWATWCAPCVARMPRLRELHSTYGDPGLQIVGVNLDAAREDLESTRDVLQQVRGFLIDHGITWPNVVPGEDTQAITGAYGVTSIPSNVLIGRDGTVLAVDLHDDQLQTAIEKALGDGQ